MCLCDFLASFVCNGSVTFNYWLHKSKKKFHGTVFKRLFEI